MTYKPLPEYLTIQPSKIQGLGLFTLTDIDKGVNIGITHIEDFITKKLDRKPLGGFINHSETPNLKRVEVQRYHYIYAIVDIPMGSELTLKYQWYKPGGDNNDNAR